MRSLVMRSLVMRRFMGCRLVMCRLRLRRLVLGCSRMRSLMMRGSGLHGLLVCVGMRSLVMNGFGLRPLMMHRFRLRALVMHGRGLSGGIGLNYGVRVSLIDRVVLVTIVSSFLLMRVLRRCRLKTTIPRCRLVRRGWSRLDSTRTIKADVIIDRFVVDHGPVNVGVMDDRRINVPRRRVIPKAVALPSAAVETGSVIAVAIVDTSVESDVRPPITAVPTIVAVGKTPVARGPIVSWVRNLDPGTGHPEITIPSEGPVAGTPKISVFRTRRLFVNDEGRRRNGDRDILSEQRRRGAQQKGEEDIAGFHQVQ